MTTQSIVNLLILASYLLIIIPEAWIDGKLKKTGKMYHNPKAITLLGIISLILVPKLFQEFPSVWMFLPIILIRKPIFDYVWAIGNGNTQLPYVGSTDITDRFIRWTGIWDWSLKHKFPVMMFLYLSMIFFAIVWSIELGK